MLVGVHRPAPPRGGHRTLASTSWPCWSTPPAPTRSARVVQRRDDPEPATFIGKGKAEELRELADDLDADTVVFDDELTPAQQLNLEKLLGRTAHRPHRGDPRHLRPERPQPGGQGPGRAGPAPLPPAAPAGPGQRPQPAGRWHRHPRSRRDPARGRPAPARAARPQARGRAARHRPPPRHPAQGAAPSRASARWRSSATPTPASRRCSTGSPTPGCWSRTGCSPPSTPPPAGSTCPAASRCC